MNIDVPIQKVNVEEPIYQDSVLSFGIAPILNRLHEWATTTKRPVWDIVLVNMSTILRNCLKVDRDVLAQVQRDVSVLTHYVSAYMSLDHRPPVVPKLIFYYPMYRIPKQYVLPPNKQYTEILKIEHKYYPKVSLYTESHGNLQVSHVPVGRSNLPHIDLIRYMDKIHPSYRYSRVCMLSSMPVDYHISRYVPDTSVLRSHTADLMQKSTFGEAIFKAPVPFNPCTHLLLGDKKLIKNATTVKSKRVLLELAMSNKWKYQPEHVIKRQLLLAGLVTKEFLGGINF